MVTVSAANGQNQSGLSVYAFSGTTYSGYSGTTDPNGQVSMTLPQGSYRFRADKDSKQYWSGSVNTCTIPGCLTDVVTLPATDVTVTKTITYSYDPLNRLTAADYSTGEYFHYTYDNAGNRLTEDKKTASTGADQTTSYTYDNANRMTYVNGVAYTWDANGNMLSDGTSTYIYDHANRLVSVTSGSNNEIFTYNGLGDRLTETVGGNTTQFINDINSGLTQVLSDETNTYSYGLGRISQTNSIGTSYFLGDALGSVRQLADSQGKANLANRYEPYGDVLISVGSAKSAYGFTGEMQDSYIKLIDLRSRWYDPATARFTSHDTWPGDSTRPQSYNGWNYVEGNPINNMDPSGMITGDEATRSGGANEIIARLLTTYNVNIVSDWGYYDFFLMTFQDTTNCPQLHKWLEGNWSLKELNWVSEGFDELANGLGGKEKIENAIGKQLVVNRIPFGSSFSPPGILRHIFNADIVFRDDIGYSESFAKGTVIHEFGHVWDYSKDDSISMGLMNQLGTWKCPWKNNRGYGKDDCWDPYLKHVTSINGGTAFEEEYIDTDIPPGMSNGCANNSDRKTCDTYAYGYGQIPWLTKAGAEDWAMSLNAYLFSDSFTQQGETALQSAAKRKQYVIDQISSIP